MARRSPEPASVLSSWDEREEGEEEEKGEKGKKKGRERKGLKEEKDMVFEVGRKGEEEEGWEGEGRGEGSVQSLGSLRCSLTING